MSNASASKVFATDKVVEKGDFSSARQQAIPKVRQHTSPSRTGKPDVSVLSVFLALSPFRSGTSSQRSAQLLIVGGATLLFFRLPAVLFSGILNEDEAQMAAQAITLQHFPIPWRYVDGTTSGPLNSAVLALPSLFGQPISLLSTRLVAVLITAGTLVTFYAIMRKLCGDLVARVSFLLPLAVLCAVTDGSVTQYASELLPMLLVGLAALGLTKIALSTSGRVSFWTGIAVGSLPFAKLQAAPLAVVLLIAAVMLCLQAPVPTVRRRLLSLVAGTCTVPVLILIPVIASGALEDFCLTYIVFPQTYIAENCCHAGGLNYFLSDPPLASFFLVAFALASAVVIAYALSARRLREPHSPTQAGPLAVAIALILSAIYAIEAPQTPFEHYLLFLIFPIAGVYGFLLGNFLRLSGKFRSATVIRQLTVTIVTVLSLLPLGFGSLKNNPYIGHSSGTDGIQYPIVLALRQNIRPGDRAAIWGWMPQYLVDTGAIMGTRDSISQFQIEARSFTPYYRQRYMADMVTNRPRFLIEAVSPDSFAYHNPVTQGIDGFPALHALVSKSYHLVFDLKGVRLYERKEAR